jgi:hypothetical protein
MKGKILYDIRYLSFDTPGVINHPHFTLTNDTSIRDKFYTDSVIKSFGERIRNYDKNSAFIYHEFDIETDNKSVDDVLVELINFGSKHVDYVSNFLAFLWFVKDNSVCIYNSLILIPEIDDAILVSNLKHQTYKVSGELEMSVFNKHELLLAMRYYEGFAPYAVKSASTTKYKGARVNIQRDESGKIISASENKSIGVPYSSYNCVERGLHYLGIARKERFPAFRIAFYVAILESIFTTDAFNVSHKVAERMAIYLEEEKMEMVDLYDFIIDVYKIRSTFMHGQKFSEENLKFEKLLPQVIRLDETIRAIMIMITQVDYEKFTKLVPKGNSTKNTIEARENYLKYMIFNNFTS